MALSFEEAVSAAFTFKEFSSGDQENADGWGLGWYPDRSSAIVKEPRKWRESRYAQFLCDYTGLQSPILIAHIRRQTRGGLPSHADTHPFGRELGGSAYVFAHNGTLDNRVWQLPLGPAQPLGATDSEHAFCYLLHEIAQRGVPLAAEPDWRWLHGVLGTLNELGQLNMLLADGERLFCYHDLGGWKGLYFRIVRIGDHELRHFEDEAVAVNIEGTSANRGHVIASRPLSASAWHPFRRGELMVLEKGAIRFSSHRSG
jgi:glutamine amidotransferase